MLAKLVQSYHLKIFFSNKYLHASILNKLNNNAVVSVSTNNPNVIELLGQFSPKNDEQACRLAGRILADRAKRKQVSRAGGAA